MTYVRSKGVIYEEGRGTIPLDNKILEDFRR